METSHNFARPDNTLARHDKDKIWQVGHDDEKLLKIKTEIEEIIDENITMVE